MRRVADYVADLELDTKRANTRLRSFDRDARDTGKQIAGRFGIVGTTLAKNLAVGGVVGAGVGLLALAKNAAALEEGFIGVQKTTDFTDDEINTLKRSLFELGSQVPVNIKQLIDIAKVAGQLGLGKEGVAGIKRFTEAFAKLEIASDRTVSGELGAQQFARFLDNSGAGIDKAEEIASAFTALGNESKLTEGQLLKLAVELAKTSKTFGLTAQQVLGLSTTLIELGVQPEVARTSFVRFFRAVDTAKKTGENLKQLSKITGLTSKEFLNLQKTNPSKLIVAFAEGLSRADKEGVSFNKELKDLGLGGSEAFTVLTALASGSERLAEKIALANSAYRENTALNKEVTSASKSFNSQVKILNNNFSNLGDSLAGSGLIGLLSSMVSQLSEGVTISGQLVREFKEIGEFEPVRLIGQEGFSQAEINEQARKARDLANSISQNPNLGGGISGLIDRKAPILTGSGVGAFVQRAEQLGILSDENRGRIRDLRAEQFSNRQNGLNSSGSSGGNNVEVKNNINIQSTDPVLAGQEVGRAVAQDVSLAVGT